MKHNRSCSPFIFKLFDYDLDTFFGQRLRPTLEAGFVSSELAQSVSTALTLLRLQVQTLGPYTPHIYIHHPLWCRLRSLVYWRREKRHFSADQTVWYVVYAEPRSLDWVTPVFVYECVWKSVWPGGSVGQMCYQTEMFRPRLPLKSNWTHTHAHARTHAHATPQNRSVLTAFRGDLATGTNGWTLLVSSQMHLKGHTHTHSHTKAYFS